jgi:acetyl-CoA acetyltransferase
MYVADGLGFGTLSWCAGLHEGANQIAAFVEAIHAVLAGACRYVLIYTQVYRPKHIQYGESDVLASRGVEQFMRPYGWTLPFQRAAAWTNRIMYETGLTEEDIGYVVLNDRKWAAANPDALFSSTITMDEYLQSKSISPPLKLIDCDMPVDAAFAWVITSAERARDLKQKPIYIAGAQVGLAPRSGDHDAGGIFTYPDFTHTVHEYTMSALWENAGITRNEMSLAFLYDAFSPLALFWLKALGYAKWDEAGSVMRSIYEGSHKVAVNTNGGILSTGRSHGASLVCEGVTQLRGVAGERQIKNATAGVVTMGGMSQDSGAMVLVNQPP